MEFLYFSYQTIRLQHSFTGIFVVLNNQIEVFTYFKVFLDQNKTFFYETSQFLNFIEFF